MISLTSRWYLVPGRRDEAREALTRLAHAVHEHEPDTLAYLVHLGRDDEQLVSLPANPPDQVTFFEIYRDREAFLAHVGGPVFTGFVADHGDLFLQGPGGKPFRTVAFLDRVAGFVRAPATGGDSTTDERAAVGPAPPVMAEVIARDQERMLEFYTAVFDWQYEMGGEGFAYVHYPAGLQPRLAGIGQAQPDVPGFEPGVNFYLQVDDLDAAIERVLAAGGSRFVDPTPADGYAFAMVRDPEGNPIGLILPFAG